MKQIRVRLSAEQLALIRDIVDAAVGVGDCQLRADTLVFPGYEGVPTFQWMVKMLRPTTPEETLIQRTVLEELDAAVLKAVA